MRRRLEAKHPSLAARTGWEGAALRGRGTSVHPLTEVPPSLPGRGLFARARRDHVECQSFVAKRRSDHLRASSHPAAAPSVLQSTSVVAVVRPGMASCNSSIPSERNSPVTTVRRRDQPKDQRTAAGRANRTTLPTTLTGLSCCVDQGASSTRFGVEVGRRVTTRTSASDAASAARCGSLLTRGVLPGGGTPAVREVGLPCTQLRHWDTRLRRRAPPSRVSTRWAVHRRELGSVARRRRFPTVAFAATTPKAAIRG